MLLAPIALWAQPAEPALSEIDLSDVVMIEPAAVSTPELSSVAAPIESEVVEPATVSAPELTDVEISKVTYDPSSHVDAPAVPVAVDKSALSDFGVIAAVQADEAVADVVVPEVSLDSVGEVVEIPDMPTAGVVVDVEAPEIPEVTTTALPSESEVVLELPGQDVAAGSVSMSEEETISVDFPDEDVRTILRNVADLFDLNVVIPDSLQGRTSVKLRNITWRQVFEVVLKQQNYTYVEDRNIIEIISIEELTTEPVDTRVFVVNYARAEELQASIAPLIDSAAGGRIQVDVRSNALVITERPSRMNKIQEIIERLDKATDQVMIESKFIEVTNTDIRNVGVDWTSLSGYGVSAGEMTREWSRTRGNENTTTTTTSNSDGFNSTKGLVFDESEGVVDVAKSLSGTSRLDSAVFSADEFRVVLSALEQKDDVKLVSNPTVVTLDNTQAKISIGERYPIPTYTFNAETGQRQLDEIEYEDIGINLDVTPQVNSAGFINLKILPEVSSSDRFALVEGTQIPIIDSRRTETTIMIKDGYTLAIGGLAENRIADRGSKVPILGDLPGIGRFFSSESDEIYQRNLIIFITAKTLNPDGSTYRDIIDPRVLNRMGVTPADVPGYQLSEEDRATLTDLENFRAQTKRTEAMAKSRNELKAIEQARKQAAKDAGKLASEAAAAADEVSAK
jgi:type IV pilus assembly protein PilQ